VSHRQARGELFMPTISLSLFPPFSRVVDIIWSRLFNSIGILIILFRRKFLLEAAGFASFSLRKEERIKQVYCEDGWSRRG